MTGCATIAVRVQGAMYQQAHKTVLNFRDHIIARARRECSVASAVMSVERGILEQYAELHRSVWQNEGAVHLLAP